jgi:flagellar basal-body rod protein FlgB
LIRRKKCFLKTETGRARGGKLPDFKVISDSAAYLTGRLGYLSDRHQLLSQNLAHMETPNYRAKDLSFDGYLNRSEESADVLFQPRQDVITTGGALKANGNDVNMEQEMAKLADNSVEYMTAIEILKKNVTLMKISVADK